MRTDPRSRTSTWGEPLGWYLGFSRFLRVARFFFAWFRAFWASMACGIDWFHTMNTKELSHIIRVFVSLKFRTFFSPRTQGAAYHAGNSTWITLRFLDWIRKFRVFMISKNKWKFHIVKFEYWLLPLVVLWRSFTPTIFCFFPSFIFSHSA